MQNQPRKFNPGLNQDDKSLIAQFVVRLPLLQIILRTIKDNVTSPICQHRLYYGPRGRGKTMLMARVAAELRVNSEFSAAWIPIRLQEESYYEISNISEFWLEVMRELCRTLADEYTENANLSLKHLSDNWSHPNLTQMAQAAVLEQLDKINKKAVLMIENLHQLVEETDDDFAGEIRRIMQNEPNIMFLVTATTRFDSLDNAQHPFFEIFATSELKRLKRSEAAILWNTLTHGDKTETEIAPLDILTGGSPRLLNIIAQFSKNNSIRDLMENLTALIDEYTDYFKSQLDSLAPKERRVFLALADLWQQSSAKEVAERARMDIRSTSALLGRLEHKGALKVNATQPRKKMYGIAERLFCIYYKLRRNRNPDAIIQGLVQFMTDFYTPAEIENIRTLHLNKKTLTQYEGMVLEKLSFPTKENISVLTSNHIDKEVLDIIKLENKTFTFGQQGDAEQALTIYHQLIERYQQREETEIVELVAKAMVNQAFSFRQQNDNEKALIIYQQLIERYQQREEMGIVEQVAKAMANQAITYRQQGDSEQALAIYQQLIERYQQRKETGIVEQVAKAMINQAFTFEQQDDSEHALAIYQQLIKRYQQREETEILEIVAKAMFNQAFTFGRQGDSEKELALYQQLIESYQQQEETKIVELVAKAMVNQAFTFRQQGDNEKALVIYQQLIESYQQREETEIVELVANAMLDQAITFGQLGDSEKALAINQQLVISYQQQQETEIVEQVAKAMFNQAITFGQQGNRENELSIYQQIIGRYQQREESGIVEQVVMAMINQANLWALAKKWTKAETSYQQALSLLADKKMSQFESLAATASLGPLLCSQAEALSASQQACVVNVISEANSQASAKEKMTLVIGIAAVLPNKIALPIIQKSIGHKRLRPLIIALQQEMGIKVRASEEELEVAIDVKKRMAEMREKYCTVTPTK